MVSEHCADGGEIFQLSFKNPGFLSVVIKIRRVHATRNPTQQRGALVAVRQLSLMELCENSEPSKWDVLMLPPFVLMLPPFVFKLREHLPSRKQLQQCLTGWGQDQTREFTLHCSPQRPDRSQRPDKTQHTLQDHKSNNQPPPNARGCGTFRSLPS